MVGVDIHPQIVIVVIVVVVDVVEHPGALNIVVCSTCITFFTMLDAITKVN